MIPGSKPEQPQAGVHGLSPRVIELFLTRRVEFDLRNQQVYFFADFFTAAQRSLLYAARVRAGLVPASRRELHSRLKPLVVESCPFSNLPEAKSGRWGQGLTAEKMGECIWVQPKLVANFEFLEWSVLQKCTDEGVNMA